MTVATRRLRAAEKLLADVHAITSKEGITTSALHAMKLKLMALAAKAELFPPSDFAMPVAGGNAFNICVNASSPPADAPMPTIGKGSPRGGLTSRRWGDGSSGAIATPC